MTYRANITSPQPPIADPTAKPPISSLYTAQLDVRSSDGNLTLETPLPENFMFGMTSNFDRPFAKPFSQLVAEKTGLPGDKVEMAENTARVTTGITTVHKFLSAAVWSSGSELTFDIPFVIHAYSNAQIEVVDVVKRLMQLAAPGEALGFLTAPGPYIMNFEDIMNGNTGADYTLGGDNITLSIGRFLVFNPCIIRNVQCTFDTQFDHTGAPLSAMVNVTFESYFTTTKNDIERLFDPLARGVKQFEAQE